jgi:TATA-box binding protein (TBP) (component of TFIID and TFIIIB)
MPPTLKGTRTIKNITGTTTTNSNSTLTTINGTSTSTYYNPNIGNTYIYQGNTPTPFSINFSWDGKSVNISLKNGNDIFKLANAFMEWLDKNEIEYEVKTSGKKKKK